MSLNPPQLVGISEEHALTNLCMTHLRSTFLLGGTAIPPLNISGFSGALHAADAGALANDIAAVLTDGRFDSIARDVNALHAGWYNWTPQALNPVAMQGTGYIRAYKPWNYYAFLMHLDERILGRNGTYLSQGAKLSTIAGAAESEADQPSEAYLLDQKLGLSGGAYYTNWAGHNEKWMQGAGGTWYYIKPDGSLCRWVSGTNNLTGDPLIEQLDVSFYTTPAKLHDAFTGTTSTSTSTRHTFPFYSPVYYEEHSYRVGTKKYGGGMNAGPCCSTLTAVRFNMELLAKTNDAAKRNLVGQCINIAARVHELQSDLLRFADDVLAVSPGWDNPPYLSYYQRTYPGGSVHVAHYNGSQYV